MAEGTEAAAATVPGEGAPVQPAQSVPDGMRLVSNDDFSRLSRIESAYKGERPLVDAILKAGVKSPEDFGTMHTRAQQFAKFEQAGIPADALLAAMEQGVNDDGAANMGVFDPESFKAEIMADMQRQQAQAEYDRALAGHDKLFKSVTNDELFAELLGENPSDFHKAMLQSHLQMQAHGMRELYGDDHPLSGNLAPLNDELVGQALASVREQYAKAQGAALDNAAKAAAGGKPPAKPSGTPAGSGSRQGAPEDEPPADPHQELRSRAKAELDKARRVGGAV